MADAKFYRYVYNYIIKTRMKEKIIKKIQNLMHKYEISINDIRSARETTPDFDLLCEVNGKLVRLPFDKGVCEKIFGIFHKINSNMFLHVDEMPETPRDGTNEYKIPFVNYWEEIFNLKDDLNDVLTKLGFAEIDGCYYARSSYIPQGNWIVAFDKDLDNLASDYYGNSEIAKIRYFGLYQE